MDSKESGPPSWNRTTPVLVENMGSNTRVYTIDMGFRCLLLSIVSAMTGLRAQTNCPTTPVYSPCDIVFELNEMEAAAHPNPYMTVDLRAEFRSPRHRTYLMPAFWDGGRRMVIRFSPTEAGDWDYRVSGNIQRFDGGIGKFAATPGDNPALGC